MKIFTVLVFLVSSSVYASNNEDICKSIAEKIHEDVPGLIECLRGIIREKGDVIQISGTQIEILDKQEDGIYVAVDGKENITYLFRFVCSDNSCSIFVNNFLVSSDVSYTYADADTDGLVERATRDPDNGMEMDLSIANEAYQSSLEYLKIRIKTIVFEINNPNPTMGQLLEELRRVEEE